MSAFKRSVGRWLLRFTPLAGYPSHMYLGYYFLAKR
jgi:hypothetical protein